MIKDSDRPYLIINCTVNYRSPDSFSVTQECFEMTRLYSGSRSLGYIHTKDLIAREKPLRIRRDTIAISGAATAFSSSCIRWGSSWNGTQQRGCKLCKDI
ncbi:MAG: hypothetical protein SWO11_02500 [Thermodesulfobacteriota bacterium]|nr:hypothetical protein [Thermodesulfobacteriota bacterium]